MMSDQGMMDLIRQTPLSFVGTVQYLGSATMDVPVDDRTAVVYLDQVLHAPEALRRLASQNITVQFDAASDVPAAGTTAAFFGYITALGNSFAVQEVQRLPLSDVEPHLRRAADTGELPFADLERRAKIYGMCEHADACDALVLGEVVKLEKARRTEVQGHSEHDPDWWVATLAVYHVERGDVKPGEVKVRFANSRDVQWRDSPKAQASQRGLWLLHRSSELPDEAPFEILHAVDCQPVQSLDPIRQNPRQY